MQAILILKLLVFSSNANPFVYNLGVAANCVLELHVLVFLAMLFIVQTILANKW
jgi:hypothetical protein